MPATPPTPPVRRPSGEYAYASREQQVSIPSEKAPARSMSPVPDSGGGIRVDLPELGFDARVRGSLLRRFAPWIVPAVMSVLGTLGGGILGYFEGLKRGAARVAAVEDAIDEAKAQIRQRKTDDDRLFVVTDDHESRMLRVERTLKLEPPAALVVKPPR